MNSTATLLLSFYGVEYLPGLGSRTFLYPYVRRREKIAEIYLLLSYRSVACDEYIVLWNGTIIDDSYTTKKMKKIILYFERVSTNQPCL